MEVLTQLFRYVELLERRQDGKQKERDPQLYENVEILPAVSKLADNFGGIPAARHIHTSKTIFSSCHFLLPTLNLSASTEKNT